MELTLTQGKRLGAVKKEILKILEDSPNGLLYCEALWRYNLKVEGQGDINDSVKSSFSRSVNNLINEGKLIKTHVDVDSFSNEVYCFYAQNKTRSLKVKEMRECLLPILFRKILNGDPSPKDYFKFESFLFRESLDDQVPEYNFLKKNLHDKLIKLEELLFSKGRNFEVSSTKVLRKQKGLLFSLYSLITENRMLGKESFFSQISCLLQVQKDIPCIIRESYKDVISLYGENALLITRFRRKLMYRKYYKINGKNNRGQLQLRDDGYLELLSDIGKPMDRFIQREPNVPFILSKSNKIKMNPLFEANWCRAKSEYKLDTPVLETNSNYDRNQ